jgi:exo-beta-1,3-glucanase (GH17 family)
MSIQKKMIMLMIAFVIFSSCSGGSSSETGPGGINNNPPPVYGLGFSAYTGVQDPNLGFILTETQIKERLEIIAPYTAWIRTFGSSLGMEHAAETAYELGLLTAVGAWLDGDDATNDEEMNNLISAAQAGFVDLAIVGSETIYRGDLTVDELIGYIERFRLAVPGVPVTTAETYDVWLHNADLIDAVDVVMANYYPYWEGIHIDQAMSYVHNRHQMVVVKAEGKNVIVSETGWPSEGDTIGQAVPTPENAVFYFLNFVSWASAEGVDYFYFEAFDEPWKAKYEGPQGAHWGVWDEDGNLKDEMERIFKGEIIPDNWTSGCFPGGSGIPEIEFTYVPSRGSSDNLEGQVLHVDTNLYTVAVYIYVTGWWTKPYWNKPETAIACNGYFVCDITTGGVDSSASRIAAFLIPFDYDPPSMSGGRTLPNDLFDNAMDYVIIDR